MLTAFGKEIRKRRIDKEVSLGQMAELLDVSPTFLTAIETGRKSVPDEIVERMASLLKLNDLELTSLKKAAELSKTNYKMSVPFGTPAGEREVVALFAKHFHSLTSDQVAQIKLILETPPKERK